MTGKIGKQRKVASSSAAMTGVYDYPQYPNQSSVETQASRYRHRMTSVSILDWLREILRDDSIGVMHRLNRLSNGLELSSGWKNAG